MIVFCILFPAINTRKFSSNYSFFQFYFEKTNLPDYDHMTSKSLTKYINKDLNTGYLNVTDDKDKNNTEEEFSEKKEDEISDNDKKNYTFCYIGILPKSEVLNFFNIIKLRVMGFATG